MTTTGRRAETIALLDGAMAHAATQRFGDAGEPVAVDVQVTFVGMPEGPFDVQGRVCGGGRSVCFCEAEARDGAGLVVARAMATFRRRSATVKS